MAATPSAPVTPATPATASQQYAATPVPQDTTGAAPSTPAPSTPAPSTPAPTTPANPAATNGQVRGTAADQVPGTTVVHPASERAATQDSTTGEAAAPAPATSASTAAQPSTPTSTAPTALAAPVAPTAPAAPAAATAPATAPPVAEQVLPEIVRLVNATSTATTRRVTLQLAPEALGDVRVVLSVRDGAVRVSLAAGQEAQRALLEGTPELRRLLESTGVPDPRIVVRDLASASATTPTTTSTTPAGTTGQPGAHADLTGHSSGQEQAGTAGGRGDQHAGTRGGSTARDGDQDVTPTGVRPTGTATRAHQGLDVTV